MRLNRRELLKLAIAAVVRIYTVSVPVPVIEKLPHYVMLRGKG